MFKSENKNYTFLTTTTYVMEQHFISGTGHRILGVRTFKGDTF